MTFRSAFLASALLAGFAAPAAHATLITTASTTTATPIPGTTTTIGLQGVTAPYSAAPLSGPGYTVSFTGTGAGQGVVRGSTDGQYAVPVAGVSGGNPTYLTGDFGSAQTTNAASAGNYLSTGTGTITINFTSNEAALTLLWGSIDTFNTLTFLENGTTVGTLTGTQVQTALAGVPSNGFQGFGGSAYVTVNSSQAFNQVIASSTQNSFEFAGVLASSQAIPEPASMTVLGASLLGLGMLGRRRRAAQAGLNG